MKNKVLTIVMFLLIIAVIAGMEYVLSFWNTDQILVRNGDYSTADIDIAYMDVGMRYANELHKVTSAEELDGKRSNEAFFMDEAVSFEPTGYYKLLNEKNEGYVRKGKTHNLIYRDYYVTEGLATRFYRAMYGQFYIVTFSDNSTALVLIACNAEKAVEKGDYLNIIARKDANLEKTKKMKDTDEIYTSLKNIEMETGHTGYINMADKYWADNHSRGLFIMSAIKFVISFIVTLIVLMVYTKITGTEIAD